MTPTACDAFDRFEEILVRGGFHPLSPLWREGVRRFLRHRTARRWLARVGRGGAKSTMICRMAVFQVLFGGFQIPPGERHYFIIVSENVAEATGRLRLIETMLRALGVRFNRSGEVIDVEDLPLGFRVVACRVGAVSGFRAIGWAADEAAKWKAEDSFASPAREVIASMGAMTVTHPNAIGLIFSSPMATVDYHFELCELGDTDYQVVTIASSWEANPDAITEERTHELEPDHRIWLREYAAIPQAAVSAAFDPDALAAVFEPFEPPAGASFGAPVMIVDPSSGRSDAWTWAVARWVTPTAETSGFSRVYQGFGLYSLEPAAPANPQNLFHPSFNTPPPIFSPTLFFENIDGIEGRFWNQISADAIVTKLASLCYSKGIRTVIGDQRESLLLKSAFESRGLRYIALDWTSASKPLAVARLRRWLRERQIKAVAHDKLRRELSTFEEKISPSGAITFGARGSGHDDYVALLITAALADERGLLPSSPIGARTRRSLLNLPKY